MLDTRCWILDDAGYWILDTRYRMLDAGYWIVLKSYNIKLALFAFIIALREMMLDTGYEIQDTG
jgi:hypothetical protein